MQQLDRDTAAAIKQEKMTTSRWFSVSLNLVNINLLKRAPPGKNAFLLRKWPLRSSVLINDKIVDKTNWCIFPGEHIDLGEESKYTVIK